MLRTASNSWPLALIIWLGCAHPVAQPPDPLLSAGTRSASKSPDLSTAATAHLRRITVERTHGGHRASGTVLLRRAEAPEAGSFPHLKLAGSRAWLALGQKRSAIEDWPTAVACAQAGLEELGRPYTKRRVLDDSTLKIGAAQDQIKRGNLSHAASIMLEILAERIKLYAELYADEIVE